MIKKKIKKGNLRGGTTTRSIKNLLRHTGYTDKEIDRLYSEERIILLPLDLDRNVKYHNDLCVLEKRVEVKPKNKFTNRFAHLETD